MLDDLHCVQFFSDPGRPMLDVVLKDWVTDTKDTAWASNSSISLAKSASKRVRRSTLYTTTISILRARTSARSVCRAGRSGDARESHHHPSCGHIIARFPLCIES